MRIEWLTFTAGEEPLKLAFRANPPHVILGGTAGAFALLAKMDRSSPIEHADRRAGARLRPGDDRARSVGPPAAGTTLAAIERRFSGRNVSSPRRDGVKVMPGWSSRRRRGTASDHHTIIGRYRSTRRLGPSGATATGDAGRSA